MRFFAFVTALVVVGQIGAGDDANKKALAQLQGEWKMIRATFGGKAIDGEKVEKTRMTIKDDKMTILKEGQATGEEASFKIDASKKPMALDLVPPKENKTINAIFRVEGDTFSMCFAKDGGDRPTEFNSPADSKIGLLEFQRIKK